MTELEKFRSYLDSVGKDYQKVAKLEFMNANGSVEFTLDYNFNNRRSKAFIQSGNLSCNLQNGSRRQVDITFSNNGNEYDFSASKIWFGKQIRYSEGLILPSGEPYYITQGIFEIEEPNKVRNNNTNTITYRLVDKWANIDGSLLGTLEDTYQVLAGTNIFEAIDSLLKLDKYDLSNNGDYPIDSIAPLYTSYYNDKTQTLTDGTVVSLLDAPYDLTVEGGNSIASIILGLVNMIAGLVGYNSNGRLQVDASQDDILDKDKPVVWEFHTNDKNFMSVNTAYKTNDVYNDVIVVGATNDVNATARGRAQNRDPSSPTCISRIGLKTKRIPMPNYYSDDICEAYAEFMLKRYAVLNRAVTITCNQIFHIMENQVVSIVDDDTGKVTRYLVQGFSRPVSQNGTMTINAISVSDFPIATIVKDESRSLPTKGALINLNLDGNVKTYRVLKAYGNNVEILSMYSPHNPQFNENESEIYEGSELDNYLNITWYNSLNNTAKAAIVDKSIKQDLWSIDDSGNPVYVGTDQNDSEYEVSLKNTSYGSTIVRHVYALGVQDVIDYLGVVPSMTADNTTLKKENLWKMFWNTTSEPTEEERGLWLRSAFRTSYVMQATIQGDLARASAYQMFYEPYYARPALMIDLNKIEWSYATTED